MSDVIRVDKDELANQITQLESLCNDSQLSQKVASIQNSVVSSAGSSAAHVKTLNADLDGVEQQLQLLFARTLDVLKNTKTTFIQAEQGLAERIKAGKENI